LIMCILFAAFGLGFWQNIQSTREFLKEQMLSHAQDTATSLGVSLASEMAYPDQARVETLLNVIFDRGYYQRISVFDKKQQLVAERKQAMVVPRGDVPAWFVGWVDLKNQQAYSEMSSGWNPAGRVVVVSHPGYAYQQLWTVAQKNCLTLLVSLLISAILLAWLLRKLLNPLQEIVGQVESISHNQFVRLQHQTKTPELKALVDGMNHMVGAIEKHVQRLTKEAELWQKEAFDDGLTGLPNRKSFQRHLEQLEYSQDQYACVCVALLRIYSIEQANLLNGYREGDKVIQAIAELISKPIVEHNGAVVARLSGPEFGILLRGCDEKEAEDLLNQTVKSVSDYLQSSSVDMTVHSAAVLHTSTKKNRHYFVELDKLLQQAQIEHKLLLISHQDLMLGTGGKQYKTQALWDALDTLNFQFISQTLKGKEPQAILGDELFLQIKLPDESWCSAGKLLPRFSESDETSKIDQIIVEKALQQAPIIGFKMINIAPQSLFENSAFIRWVVDKVVEEKVNPLPVQSLAFEFSQIMAPKFPHLMKQSISLLKQKGIRVGIDHFGLHSDSLNWLTQLDPDYVKLDPAVLFGRDATLENQIFVEALLNLCHSMAIAVYAMDIEIEPQLRFAQHLGFDGYQGFFISQPA